MRRIMGEGVYIEVEGVGAIGSKEGDSLPKLNEFWIFKFQTTTPNALNTPTCMWTKRVAALSSVFRIHVKEMGVDGFLLILISFLHPHFVTFAKCILL